MKLTSHHHPPEHELLETKRKVKSRNEAFRKGKRVLGESTPLSIFFWVPIFTFTYQKYHFALHSKQLVYEQLDFSAAIFIRRSRTHCLYQKPQAIISNQ